MNGIYSNIIQYLSSIMTMSWKLVLFLYQSLLSIAIIAENHNTTTSSPTTGTTLSRINMTTLSTDQSLTPPSTETATPILKHHRNNSWQNATITTAGPYTFPPEEAGNLTDTSVCKLTHMGLDYLGTIGKSESGVRCQAWASPKPLHPVDPSYTDETFSDFSKTKAKNYCRNPSKDVTGPWCYTMAPDNIYETCGIPLCIYTECRVSGPGMEYGGSVKRTTTGKNCLKWNKKRPKVRIGDEVISLNQYHNSRFPDESASYARKSCRNPDGDLGGPWCFVETSIKNEVTKQYCDVPFCQSELCTIITRNPEIYSHYTSFSESLTNFTFGVKLWNPDDYLKANARLVLSLFALPLTGKEIHSLGVGLEIYIDNTKSGLTVGNTGKVDYEKSFGNIKSDQFTYFTLTWWHNILTLFKEGRKEPLFMADYKGKGTLMGFQMNKFRYYSARGTDIIWSLPYCDDSDQCDVHTTIGVEFQRYFPLPETSIGYDLNFYLRATHSAYIKLVVSPVIEYPVVKVMIHRSDNYTRIEYQEHERSSTVILQDALSENLLNYWNWQEFTLSVFMGELQLYIRKDSGSYAIVLAQHEDFKKIRWFSPGSDNSIAHWTFSCLPPADFNPPQAYPPECALNKKEPDYNGTQDLTNSGLPCLPWGGSGLVPKDDVNDLFEDEKAKFSAWNYCRDPKNKLQGTFCYVISKSGDNQVSKQYCHIRKCKSAECKVAGTGNDYIGKSSLTRSNRTCQRWISPAMLKMWDDLAQQNVTNLTETTNSTQEDQPHVRSLNYQTLSEGGYTQLQLIKHLLDLHNWFEAVGCKDKWACLRGIYGSGKDLGVRHVGQDKNESSTTTTHFANDATHHENDTASTRRTLALNYTSQTNLSDPSLYLNLSKNPPHYKEVVALAHNPNETKSVQINVVEDDEVQTSKYDYPHFHAVDENYLNETLFADMDLKKIKNYCRNPSRDISGSWCYTEDPAVPIDLCNVKDCDKPEECTIFLSGDGKGRRVYILPQWKEEGLHGGFKFSVKQWNPDFIAGLAFDLLPLTGTTNIRLEIGADNNERIVLYYDSEIVKEKAAPHVISSGKWDNFWLQMRVGQIILGYQGVPTPFFEWTHPNASDAMNPIFLVMSTITGYPLGLSLTCDECHTEITNTKVWSKIFPIGLWMEEESSYKSFILYLRGSGDITIPLYLMPGSDQYYSIGITDKGSMIVLYKHVFGLGSTLKTSYTHDFHITETNWTTIEISFTENFLNITSNDKTLMKYKSKIPMLFYWFSLGAENGRVTWTTNCDPLDIDGDPLDGGWSKWSSWVCTVSCGGGTGYRTRTCSNPRPNIFGRLCEGSPTSTGVCNEFECGDVNPETMELIREHLRANFTSLVVHEKESVLIENIPSILGRLSRESPDAYYEWTLNGLFVDPKPGRVEFIGDDISIKKAQTSDSGVYVCMFFRINKQRLVFHVVSLAVIPKKNQINTRASRKTTLNSNAVVLGYIYTGLRQKWLLNQSIYLDHGITTLAAVSHEYLSPLNETHTGEWRCVIEQTDLGFSWTTNIVKMRVKKAPNFFTNVMEDEFTAPIFSWLKTETNVFVAIIVIVVFVVGLVILALWAYLKYGRLPELKKGNKVKNRRFMK